MKKISLMVMALMVAMTMSAETVVVDTLTSVSLGLKDADQAYTATTQTTSTSGAQYAALGYGKQAYIQIRVSNSNSGVVSTKSAGYIKSVRVIQNSEKGKKTVEIYGSNSALTSPSDLFDSSKSTKVANVSELDQTYTFALNYTYIGIRSNSGTVYLDKIIIEWTDTKPGKDPGVWTPDTISVSEARALIDKGDINTHYIKGVVASTPFILSSKNYTVWMTDIDNPSDSLEAYTMRKSKTTSDLYTSLDEMAENFGLQDTVLIFAEGIAKFKSTYETTSGYYVETLGKSSALDANAVFKYAVGARQWGKAYDSDRYKYELILSKEGEEDTENALHLMINNVNEKGIAGQYTIRTYQGDSSYVDGQGAVAGSVTIAYVDQQGDYNKYTVKADFTVGAVMYHMDTTYAISGWVNDMSEQFALVDDRPFIPQEGDTITCAQAASYAKSLGSSTGVNVYVRGFATGFQTVSGRSQQSPYMADDAASTKRVFQAYLCYTQNRDSIVKGDEIIVYGPVSYYAKDDKCQISKGQIYRVGGSNTQRPVTIEEIPAGAISVADAIAMASQMAVGDTTAEVTVKGYVTKLYKTFNSFYSSQSFYMDDAPYQQGAFYTVEAFQSKIALAAVVGDYVFITGRITKYESTEDAPARKAAGTVSYNIVNGVTKFAEIVTGLEEIKPVAAEAGVNKIMMNGQIYIIKNGVLYNAQGNMVK